MNIRTAAPLAAAAVILVLAGCTAMPEQQAAHPDAPVASPTPAPAVSAAPAPAAPASPATPAVPVPPAAPVDPPAPPSPSDVLLLVTTTATASNGATMLLTMTVHQPVAHDDPSMATTQADLLAACTDSHFVTLDSLNRWPAVLLVADVQATPGAGPAWPASSTMRVSTGSGNQVVLGSGIVRDAGPVDMDCQTGYSLSGPTTARAIAMFGSPTGAPLPSQWAHFFDYGFTANYLGGATPVRFSDCATIFTALGLSYTGVDTFDHLAESSQCATRPHIEASGD